MAISGTHYRLLQSIKHHLPEGGSLLEIGEANWYGDIPPGFPCHPTDSMFTIAKACYTYLFAPSRIVSIDKHGTPTALPHDLNEPLPDIGQFDICINHGTAEHIFNIAQVFRSMHDATVTNGLMIHESPFTGWVDHGFYCLQSTLFYDLAAANCYEVVLMAVEHIESGTIIRLEDRDHVSRLLIAGKLPNNAMLFVAFRKLFDVPFKIPMQGYYAKSLSAAGKKAWEENR